MAFAEIAAKYDKDGIEIRFLNNETVGKEIKVSRFVFYQSQFWTYISKFSV